MYETRLWPPPFRYKIYLPSDCWSCLAHSASRQQIRNSVRMHSTLSSQYLCVDIQPEPKSCQQLNVTFREVPLTAL